MVEMAQSARHRQESDSRYADKLELVFRQYEKCLDLDVAMTVVPLSEAERIRLEDDQDLAARIAVCDARVKEDLITDLRSMAKTAVSEGVRLTAIRELGRTVYPRRFKDTPVDTPAPQQSMVVRYELVEPGVSA